MNEGIEYIVRTNSLSIKTEVISSVLRSSIGAGLFILAASKSLELGIHFRAIGGDDIDRHQIDRGAKIMKILAYTLLGLALFSGSFVLFVGIQDNCLLRG